MAAKTQIRSDDDNDQGLEVLPGVLSEPSSPAEQDSSRGERSQKEELADLRIQLETQKMNQEERVQLLRESLNHLYGQKAREALLGIETTSELTDEVKGVLRTGTSILLTIVSLTNKKADSVQNLIDAFRGSDDESTQAFVETLVRLIANPGSSANEWYVLHGWDDAKIASLELLEAVNAVEEAMKSPESQDETGEKEDEDKSFGEKVSDFTKKHSSEITTALIVGGLGFGLYWLVNKISNKTGVQNQLDEKGMGTVAKVATAALVGGFVGGQILGIKGVQDMISGGDPKSWIKRPWVKGWTAAADLELSNALDYWTGNGPNEGEARLFEAMAAIFGISESRLWSVSKLSYHEFMGGKSSTVIPWYLDDEDQLRTKMKDYYRAPLEEAMPELKDAGASGNIKLKDVLLKGFKLGIIKNLDTTDLPDQDRKKVRETDERDKAALAQSREYLEKPQDNRMELQKLGATFIAQMDQLDQATDQYWHDLGIAFEDFVGFNFDFGTDDEAEYRDLKEARTLFQSFYPECAKRDHAFFKEKKEFVEAFQVFLEKHKDEDPWKPSTITQFESEYKQQILELQQVLATSLRNAEESNLKKMALDQEDGFTTNDLQEGLTFAAHGLNGLFNYLGFRFEKISEGSVCYIALTVGQVFGVGKEFYGKPAAGMVSGPLRLIKGMTWNTAGLVVKPAWKTITLGYAVFRGFNGYEYSAETLLEKMLKGEMTPEDVKRRIGFARKYEKLYTWRPTDAMRAKPLLFIENLYKLEARLIDKKAMFDYIDGKIELGDIDEDSTRTLLRELGPEKIEEIRAYKILNKIKLGTGVHFEEIVSHLKDPSKLMSMRAETALNVLKLQARERTLVENYLRGEKGDALLQHVLKKGAAVVPGELTFLRTETGGVETKHFYQYRGEEIQLKEAEIRSKASEVAVKERLTGRVPPTGEDAAWHEKNWGTAVEQLCEERFRTPVHIRENVYRVAGQEFNLTPEEITKSMATGLTKEGAIRRLCLQQATAHISIEELRVNAGHYEYKIGGEWISTESPGTPATLDEVRSKFEQHLSEQERMVDLKKLVSDAKIMKWFSTFEKVIGTAMAVHIVYFLHTAPDKKKAVCELAAGLSTFFGGMKASELLMVKKFGTPKTPLQFAGHFIVDLCGGLLLAYGFSDSFEKMFEAFLSTLPAGHGVSKEIAEVFEKGAYRGLSRMTLGSAQKGVLRSALTKGPTKLGLSGFERAFEKRIGGSFLRKIGQLAAKQGFKQVLKALGWKGVTTAALLADDATVIGVVDDVVAAGLILWMGFDLYEIVTLIANAVEVQNQMAKRQERPIVSFEIKEPKARAILQEKLIPFGLSIDRVHELPEDTLFDILRTIPYVKVQFTRENTLGYEEWMLKEGEAVGIAIYGEEGDVTAQISDEDAAQMEVTLSEMERVEEERLAA